MEQILKSRYRIGEKLSENPFSVTYRGSMIENDQPVVIKIYKRGTLSSVLVRQMRQKVKELTSLRLPGLAKIIDGDYGWQGFYYIREYVEGRTLSELLAQEKRLPPDQAASVIIEICRTLEVTHRLGIIHGALSPNNIFFDSQGQLKLADFIVEGEIKEALPMKVAFLMENSSYFSPEEIAGLPATASSDIYALGLVLFELLTGRKAYAAGSALEKLKAKPASLRDFDPNLPWYLDDIVRCCLESKPRLRFPAVSFLRESLENKNVVMPRSSSPELLGVFEATVSQYGEPNPPEEPEPLSEVGRMKIKWSREKYRTQLLAALIAAAVVLGLLYAFIFTK